MAPSAGRLNLVVAEATDDVVVDDARRLQVGVHARRAHEGESACLEVAADALRQWRLRRDLSLLPPGVSQRPAVDPVPEVAVAAAVLVLHLEGRPSDPLHTVV